MNTKGIVNFTPGPSQIYFTVEDHMRAAFKEGIPSLSHRTSEFERISQRATEGVKELLGVPVGFHVFFTSSATEIWERSIQNLVINKSLHYVNGAFSKRYFEIAAQLGKSPVKFEVPQGKGFSVIESIEQDVELIALTHNETSTGVSLPMNFVHSFKEKYKDALIVVDSVSSIPYPQYDFSKIDSLFFSVQKGFGLLFPPYCNTPKKIRHRKHPTCWEFIYWVKYVKIFCEGEFKSSERKQNIKQLFYTRH